MPIETGRSRLASWPMAYVLRGTASTRRRRSSYASTCATSSTAAASTTSNASSPSSTSTPSTRCSSQVTIHVCHARLTLPWQPCCRSVGVDRSRSALPAYIYIYAEIHGSLSGGVGGEGEPWFYFCERQEREARGGRPSRTTPSGYWKAAGTPGVVYAADDHRPIGMRKTMVFYRGRAPSGTKTKWKMNEYRAFHHDNNDGAGAGSVTGPGYSHAAAAPPNLPPQVIYSIE